MNIWEVRGHCWEELGKEKGGRFEKGDWSHRRETSGAKLALRGTREPVKVTDSDPIKAVLEDGSSGC